MPLKCDILAKVAQCPAPPESLVRVLQEYRHPLKDHITELFTQASFGPDALLRLIALKIEETGKFIVIQ